MLRILRARVCLVLLLPLVLSGGCSCGFDCNNEDSRGTTVLTLGFSDALPEDLKQVVIDVDRISFRRTGAEDVVVETFTIPALGLVAAESFKVDLLQYRGRNQLLVIEGLELAAGTYSAVDVRVLGDDVNHSFVLQADDTQRALSVSGGVLALPGMKLDRGDAAFTVEFGLAQSLRLAPTGNAYLMTADGIRVENNATAASLSGRVESSLFTAVAPCSDKSDPSTGNRVYLYAGAALADKRLGDVYTSASGTAVPANVVPPFAVATLARSALTANWEYGFGFLPAGEYTLAFACNTAADDAVNFNDLVIPQPAQQLHTLTLREATATVCDLAEGASCD